MIGSGGHDDLRASARAFALASMVSAYPDAELDETLTTLGAAVRDHEGVGPMVAALAAGLEDLQSAYIDLFDRGKGRVSLHETEHGRMRGLAKGNDLADIAGFYLAFGLDLDESTHELLDHLAVQLEFYATLLVKQDLLRDSGDATGCDVVADARRKFLTDHLGRFAGVVAAQPSVSEHAVYGPALAWCARLIAEECARLGVVPAPLDFFASGAADERDDTSCGAVHLPVVD